MLYTFAGLRIRYERAKALFPYDRVALGWLFTSKDKRERLNVSQPGRGRPGNSMLTASVIVYRGVPTGAAAR
jgi:hypothetical protein